MSCIIFLFLSMYTITSPIEEPNQLHNVEINSKNLKHTKNIIWRDDKKKHHMEGGKFLYDMQNMIRTLYEFSGLELNIFQYKINYNIIQ